MNMLSLAATARAVTPEGVMVKPQAAEGNASSDGDTDNAVPAYT